MFIETGGLDVYVRIEGPDDEEATCVVMLHSLGTDHRVWEPQAAALSASGCRVIRPDLRGHGLSAAPLGPYTADAMAEDLLGLLDAVEAGPAHLVGLSIGGLLAQVMAHRAPHAFASLTLCDTAMSIGASALWHERAATVRRDGLAGLADTIVARWITPSGQDTAAARGLRRMLLRTDPEGYAGAAEALAAADLHSTTPSLRLPTLILVGDQDQSTPLSDAEALRRAIPNSKLFVIDGAAHIPTFEQADAVTDAVGRFLGVGA